MRVHHIALRTRDPARLARFYEGTLGIRRLEERPNGSLWLDLSGAILMIERAGEGEPEVPPGSMELVALAIDPKEREAMRARLVRDAHVEAETPFTLYTRDPDGRRVGLSHYPCRDPQLTSF